VGELNFVGLTQYDIWPLKGGKMANMNFLGKVESDSVVAILPSDVNYYNIGNGGWLYCGGNHFLLNYGNLTIDYSPYMETAFKIKLPYIIESCKGFGDTIIYSSEDKLVQLDLKAHKAKILEFEYNIETFEYNPYSSEYTLLLEKNNKKYLYYKGKIYEAPGCDKIAIKNNIRFFRILIFITALQPY